jgi:hypothetical protein
MWITPLFLAMTKSGGYPQYNVSTPPVPAGKRFVVETVSILDRNAGTSVGSFIVQPTVNGVGCVYVVPLQYDSVLQQSSGTLAARMYADAGAGVYMQYAVQNASDANKYVSVSGYYITM